jgi:beta-lactam-binding protein with PASTA domain
LALKKESTFKFADIIGFFKSKIFLHTLVRLFLLFIIIWFLNSFFLKIYTNHGQKLSLQKYEGIALDQVKKHAELRGYSVVISDSLFVKGKPGGYVISQVPPPGFKVKRGRTIYVTVSKYRAETFLSEQLPVLYGKKLEHKRNELFNTFELISKIRGVQFDPGPENHILETYYKGVLLANAQVRRHDISISKGDTLEFVISTRSGGEVPIPELVCQTLAAAKFLLSSSKLELGNIVQEGEITDIETAYIIEQTPAAEMNKTIELGSTFTLKIVQEKPEKCQ